MNNKKPSSFQFRQERKRKEEESKKLSSSLTKFFKSINASIHSMSSSVISTSSCVLPLMSTTSLDSIPSTSTVDVSSFKALPNLILSPASIHTDANDDNDIDVDSSQLVRISKFEDPGL